MADIIHIKNQVSEEIKQYTPLEDKVLFDPIYFNKETYTPYSNVKEIVSTEKEFDSYLEKKKEDSQYFYRGEADATWICRSTLLREFRDSLRKIGWEYNNFKSFENTFFSYKNNHFEKMRSIFKLRPSLDQCDLQCELACQHYGLNSPLIDFTEDIRVALWFAANAHKNKANNQKGHMKIIELKKDSLYNAEELLSQSLMEHPDIGAKSLEEGNSAMFDNIKMPGYISARSEKYSSILPPTNNPNMAAQKGVLVCLGKYSHSSLEEAVMHMNTIAKTVPNGNSEIIMSVTHIKANLANHILRRIGLTERDIYPY